MADVPIVENDRRIQLIATASQVQFDADFLTIQEVDFSVKHSDNTVSPAVITDLVLNVDYTVTGVGVLAGFSIFLIGPLFPTGAAAGDFITIFGDIPIDRLADFQVAGDFNAAVVNAEEDKQIQIMQELANRISRSLQLRTEDPTIGEDFRLPIVRAGLFAAYDGAGLPIASPGPLAGVAVSAFWESILGFNDFDASGLAAIAAVNNWSRAQGHTPIALTPAATVTWDGDTQQNATLIPDQDFTLANIAGARAGFTYVLSVTQDPVTPRLITFDTNYITAGGVLPLLTATIDALDRLVVYAHTATKLEVLSGLNIS